MARYEEVQAAQIREGEHRGAANRLRTEHKEVGSGPGAGSAEVGADGGPTPAGSGESFPASFDRMVAFFRRSKGVFQQAGKLKNVRWLTPSSVEVRLLVLAESFLNDL